MAQAIYPQESPETPLHNFINHPSLENYAIQAEKILDDLPILFVPRIQYKRPGVKNTCWYVALSEKPDIWLINFTIVPSNLHIEFRLPRYFTVEKEHQTSLGMWYQNNLPTFGLKNIGKTKALELVSEYIEKVTPYVLAGVHKTVGRSSAEYLIKQDLQKLYPNLKVRHGERPIRNTNGSFLELDLQIKELKLAIEVQGPTHYPHLDIYNNYNEVKKRDDFQRVWCKENGVKLVHLEWDGYMKTLYRQHEKARREYFGYLLDKFINSDEEFIEFDGKLFREIIH